MRSSYNLHAKSYNQLTMDLLLRMKGLKPLAPFRRLPKDRVQNSAFSRYPLLSSRLRVKLNSLNTESTQL